jgi:cobalt-zinc-cadmium efflux system membrane fusion protein
MVLGGMKLYDYADLVTANGYLDVPPEKKGGIGTFMGGYVKSAELLPGDHVQKGQVLIILENIEYLKLQQSFLETKEHLAYLKSVYDIQKTLAEEKISAQRNFLQAKSDYNRMLVSYESLARQLRLLQIDPDSVKAESMVSSIRLVAPIEGFITEVHAVNGMFVNPPDFLCEIIDPTHLHIELKVFEKDLLKVRIGQKITFRIPEASKESFKGEIILIGKTVVGTERTIVVHAHIISAPLRNLTPGMYIEAQIHTDTRQLDGLPADALVTEGRALYIYQEGRTG